MLRYNLYDLSRIELPHSQIADIATDAIASAGDRYLQASDCPFQGRSRTIVLKRLIWRSIFRRERIRLAAPVRSLAA